jgi:hypothetical protein
MRVWVLRVCQQSERHLDKILNVDEFVRRIFSVTHSNDPVSSFKISFLQRVMTNSIPTTTPNNNKHYAVSY